MLKTFSIAPIISEHPEREGLQSTGAGLSLSSVGKNDIAALTEQEIANMPLPELQKVIEAAERLFPNHPGLEKCKDCERKVLEDIVITVRSCCRAQGY